MANNVQDGMFPTHVIYPTGIILKIGIEPPGKTVVVGPSLFWSYRNTWLYHSSSNDSMTALVALVE